MDMLFQYIFVTPSTRAQQQKTNVCMKNANKKSRAEYKDMTQEEKDKIKKRERASKKNI